MQRGRVMLLVAAAVAVAALLLPFFSATALGDVMAGTDGHLLPAAALVGAAVVAGAGDRRESLTGLPALAAAAAVTGAVVVVGAILIDGLLATRTTAGVEAGGAIGAGLWLTALACGIGVAGVIIGMSRRLN